ncbi:transglycosylase domain-containing protein [Leptolyngbya sp. 7M]|uniref:transglycosylase domain-containing protein n=1 Tax=Leptolyngbya sp. 7M TaxID=2812896 RepID=UPI001B8A9B38|nr:PBP1A family penicillin-binding protein [Leptolyngbya sp. 7M]QYO66123.1 PBP1A family penicillin-binding protein [Leptolyngbya sp. 7M]
MPENLTVRTTRSKMPPKGWVRARRIYTFKEPPKPLWKRVLGKIFNYWTLTAFLLILLGSFLTLGYYWFEFSDRIDRRLLSGDVFTASAGIYSAPKTLRKGEAITQQTLLDYLRAAGYIDKNVKADHTRSRYSISENGISIEPGITGTIDGENVFPPVLVKFAKDGKSIASIADQRVGKEVDRVQLEPRILSTIAREGDGRRKTVAFADLPQHLVKAIIVTEDRAFFEHYGVNIRGIARALWSRYEGEDNAALANQGGSSITQQLVKNLLLTRDPTWERKITEAYMSIILETRLSKQEIFTLYVNQIYLGQQAGVSIYGVGEAANIYFGKDVSQLTLAESAFIAGIVRSPNRYGPYKNPEKVTERRNQVLMSMLEVGEITAAEFESARNTKLELKQISSKQDLQGMPYFSQYVVDTLPSIVSDPEALQHLRVYTSIDPDLQRIAYETVVKRLERLDKFFPKQPPGNLNAALVAMRPKTGEIVAMVGGRDYLETQFNRATSAMRQPGSVFKPFVYTAAINSAYDTSSRVFTAATVIKDEKKIFTSGRDTYAPNNYGDTFTNKETTLRDALVKSKNTIAVDVGMQVNIGRVMNLAHKAGLPKVERAYPSMALGTAEATPLNVATGYTMFANLGERVLPMPITRVTAGDGTTKIEPQPDRKQVVRSDVAYILNDIMKDIVNRGTAAQVQGWGFRNEAGKRAYAGKTGTSRDGWFAGFTPELVCVVYVGFDDNADLGMKGSDSAMPIWADFMKAALDLHPEWNGDWQMPATIRKAEIDIRNGSLIRELDGAENATVAAQPTPSPWECPILFPSTAGQNFTVVVHDILETPTNVLCTNYTFTVSYRTGCRQPGYDRTNDGKADPTYFRSSTGTWNILNSAGGTNSLLFGLSNDIITAGDYTGMVKLTSAPIVRPRTPGFMA